MEQNIAFALSLATMAAALAGYVRMRRRLATTTATLNALRSNCYVTSERGHRVRYVSASELVRARAEGVSREV